MFKSSSQARTISKPNIPLNLLRNESQLSGANKRNPQSVAKILKQKTSPKFFEKILMESCGPKTYQNNHNAKKYKPIPNKYQDVDQAARIIQSGWKRFKRIRLVNKIQNLENIINSFSNIAGSRRQISHQQISNKQNFEEFVIERLLLDFHICNKIIQNLQKEHFVIKEESQKQSTEVRSVLEEYIQYIDSILKQKQDLEDKIINLQELNQLNETCKSQLINSSHHKQLSDRQSYTALEEIKENISSMANSVNLQVQRNPNQLDHESSFQ